MVSQSEFENDKDGGLDNSQSYSQKDFIDNLLRSNDNSNGSFYLRRNEEQAGIQETFSIYLKQPLNLR